MTEESSVNLYALILKLPEHVTNPDHYEILGLPRFTDDAKAIRAASADQNGKILCWQNSKYYQATKQLTLQIVEAKRVLGTPERKKEYDEHLKTLHEDRTLGRDSKS